MVDVKIKPIIWVYPTLSGILNCPTLEYQVDEKLELS